MRRQNLLLISTMLLCLITGCDSTSKIVVNTIYLDTDNNTTVKVDVNSTLEVLNVESNVDLGTKKFDKKLNTTLTYITNQLTKDNKINILIGYKKADEHNNYYLGYVYQNLVNLSDYYLIVNEYDELVLKDELSANKYDFASKLNKFYPFANLDNISSLEIKDYIMLYNQLGTFSKDEFTIYNKSNNVSKISNDYSSVMNDYRSQISLEAGQDIESEKVYPVITESGISYIYEGFSSGKVYPVINGQAINSYTSPSYDIQSIADAFNADLHNKEEAVVNQVAREVLGDKYAGYRSYIYDKLLYDGVHKSTSQKVETEDVIFNHILNKLQLNKEDIKYGTVEYIRLGLGRYYVVSLYNNNNDRYQIIGDSYYLFIMNATLNGVKINNLDYEVTCEKFGINEFINQTHSGQF